MKFILRGEIHKYIPKSIGNVATRLPPHYRRRMFSYIIDARLA